MRLLDTISYWAKSTHQSYNPKLKAIQSFQTAFSVPILQPTALQEPPESTAIPLMWCQELHSLKMSQRKYDRDVPVPLSFGTIRQLRSAASQFLSLDALTAHPDEAYLTKDNKVLFQACRPTDSLPFTFMARGMVARLGDNPKPSMALLDRHVRCLDQELDALFRASRDPIQKRDIALAGLANLALWLGWLRSSECFDLNWNDISCLEPSDSAREDLPPNCGLLRFRLAPETKSDRGRQADVLLAYRTLSGYCVGLWYHRAKSLRTAPDGPVFCNTSGTRWTSKYFRTAYLYPSLHRQRLAGDKLLAPFDGGTGGSIEQKMWSLHCYRRGGRSHVSRGGNFGAYRFRKATKDQIYEHARWRRSRSAEAIDVIYREWTPLDRIKLTFYCH